MNRRYHRLVRAIRRPVFAFHAHAFPVLDDQRLDPLVGQNHAAMRFDKTRQGYRQPSRPALGEWPGFPLLVQWDIRGPARHRVLYRLQRIGTAHHERSAVVVLKRVANDFPCRHRQPSLPQFAVRMIRQPFVEWFSETDRRERDGVQDRFDGLIFRDHLPVSFAIFLGKLRKLSARSIEVAPLRQVAAVGKRHVIDGIGMDILEAIISELQLIVAQEWISMDSVVRRGANVMRESAQRQLRGFDTSSHDWAAFQHHAAIPRFREVRRRDQAIVSGSCNNDIESFWHDIEAPPPSRPCSPAEIRCGQIRKLRTEASISGRSATASSPAREWPPPIHSRTLPPARHPPRDDRSKASWSSSAAPKASHRQ